MRRGRGGGLGVLSPFSELPPTSVPWLASPPSQEGQITASILNCCPSHLAQARGSLPAGVRGGEGSSRVWPPGRGCLFLGSPGSGMALWCHLEEVTWAGPGGTGPGQGQGHWVTVGSCPPAVAGP